VSNFWVLDCENEIGEGENFARWESSETKWRKVTCDLQPDHCGIRERISSLSVVIREESPNDFIWTPLRECLVQRGVLDLFGRFGFTGFTAVPAAVRSSRSVERLPKFWELVVVGKAGLASARSGLTIRDVCTGCGLTKYSQILDPSKVVDESNWDGSDFFRVEPISGWTFVTDRVIKSLIGSGFKGWHARTLESMKNSFDIAIPVEPLTRN
jgi:hypothetical protein